MTYKSLVPRLASTDSGLRVAHETVSHGTTVVAMSRKTVAFNQIHFTYFWGGGDDTNPRALWWWGACPSSYLFHLLAITGVDQNLIDGQV